MASNPLGKPAHPQANTPHPLPATENNSEHQERLNAAYNRIKAALERATNP